MPILLKGDIRKCYKCKQPGGEWDTLEHDLKSDDIAEKEPDEFFLWGIHKGALVYYCSRHCYVMFKATRRE